MRDKIEKLINKILDKIKKNGGRGLDKIIDPLNGNNKGETKYAYVS